MINISDRTIFCRDNLDVLQGINSESVDLIYLDPPFNKNKTFTAPIGSSAEGASFKDYFREEDVKDEWIETIKEDHVELYNFLNGVKSISNSKHYLYNYCYLCYMAIRLIEMRRVLKDTGSVYFHCDSTMSHYIKIMMDTIFGEKNFINEIIWHYGKWSNKMKGFQKNHDILLFYSKDYNYFFNALYIDKRSSKPYHTNKVQGQGQLLVYDKTKTPNSVIEDYKQKGYRVVYVENKKVLEHDVWTFLNNQKLNILNSQAKERLGYPTQKPLALLERIIRTSSNERNVVLDPFCGCATTCIASEMLNRKWIGIDISVKAYELVKERLNKEVEGKFDFEDKNDHGIKVHFSTDSPKRTDKNGENRLKKYVYIISHPEYPGEFKVGIAKDCDARLNSYQTSDPDRTYKLEYSYLTHNFRELEKYIHAKFNNKHEWVTGNLKDIINEIKSYDKPFG